MEQDRELYHRELWLFQKLLLPATNLERNLPVGCTAAAAIPTVLGFSAPIHGLPYVRHHLGRRV